jgi:hypothetical protein
LSLNLNYISKVLKLPFPCLLFYVLIRIDPTHRIPLPPTMASEDNKLVYDEKNGSSAASAVESVGAGRVSRLKRRLPHFSLEVRQEESSFATTKKASNADFDPIPPSKRTWNWGAYVAYWMADAWAVSNWEVGEFPVTCFACGARERGGAETLVVQLLP